MAAEGDVDLDLEAEENCTGKPAEKPRKHDSGAADLERVTDYAEEKEISSSDLETAMSVIGDRRSREQKAKQEREKELAKVTIKKEDVELIMSEMEISRSVAERSLREHLGNVVEALVALTNWLRTLFSYWTASFIIVIFVFYSQITPQPSFLF